MSKYKETEFFLCFIDVLSKYEWVVPLTDKKGITITNAFQKVLYKSNHKPNKIWVDKRSEFYNRLIKITVARQLIGTYSAHNEGKSVVAETFIRTAITKNFYIHKLDDLVNEYNNTYHRTIKMKPFAVKISKYIDLF